MPTEDAAADGPSPLTGDALDRHRSEMNAGWIIRDGHRLVKTYDFPDFVTALAFVNRVGEMSERREHHPVIELTWGEVTLQVWSHDADGLTDRDFAWAKAADELPRETAEGD